MDEVNERDTYGFGQREGSLIEAAHQMICDFADFHDIAFPEAKGIIELALDILAHELVLHQIGFSAEESDSEDSEA